MDALKQIIDCNLNQKDVQNKLDEFDNVIASLCLGQFREKMGLSNGDKNLLPI